MSTLALHVVILQLVGSVSPHPYLFVLLCHCSELDMINFTAPVGDIVGGVVRGALVVVGLILVAQPDFAEIF